jgi:hypothetical protein
VPLGLVSAVTGLAAAVLGQLGNREMQKRAVQEKQA